MSRRLAALAATAALLSPATAHAGWDPRGSCHLVNWLNGMDYVTVTLAFEGGWRPRRSTGIPAWTTVSCRLGSQEPWSAPSFTAPGVAAAGASVQTLGYVFPDTVCVDLLAKYEDGSSDTWTSCTPV